MLDGEVYVLQAVRDTLRTKLNLSEQQCKFEYDEQVPAIAGDLYYAVIPAGTTPGPNHNASGGVIDSVHSVKVTVFKRCTAVARDKNRDVFLDQYAGINQLVSAVMYAIDWQMDVMTLANHLLWNALPNSKGFIEMLRASSMDAKPRMINSETYAAGQTPGVVAMARSVTFSGCRRMQYVNQNQ